MEGAAVIELAPQNTQIRKTTARACGEQYGLNSTSIERATIDI